MTGEVWYRVDSHGGEVQRRAHREFLERAVLPRLADWCASVDLALTESDGRAETQPEVVPLSVPARPRSRFLALADQILLDARAAIAARYPNVLALGGPAARRRQPDETSPRPLANAMPAGVVTSRPATAATAAPTPVQVVVRISYSGATRTEVLATRTLTLGRSSSCDIELVDPMVSRIHAALLVETCGIVIRDNGSANGVYVNGKLVDEAVIRPGDEVTLGGTKLYVSLRP